MEKSSNNAIFVENLYFSYGERTILKNLSFSIKKGELWGLMGANGSGKSTLLRCLLNFLKADYKTFCILNTNAKKISIAKFAKLVAFVPQEHKLSFSFLAKEVVLMGRTPFMGGIFGLSKQDIKKAKEALDLLNIAHLANQSFLSLSGGERQLVLIARAIAQDTPIILLDEPTSALDFHNQILFWKTLQKLKKNGKTIFVCCHEPNHILWFCSHALALQNGEIYNQGKVKDVINSQMLKDIYKGNYAICEVKNQSIIYFPLL